MRKQRKEEEQAAKVKDAKAWREQSLQEGRKKVARAAGRQKQKGGSGTGGGGEAAGGQPKQQQQQQQQHQQLKQQQQQQQQQQPKKRQRQDQEGDGEAALAFNKLDFGSGGWRGRGWGSRLKWGTRSAAHCSLLSNGHH